MPQLGSVDERFQSYNVEMVEVTGGRFWKPYDDVGRVASTTPSAPSGSDPVGMSPFLFEYRAPIDLTSSRLRTLAAALAPAYVRVSGTWANSVFFDDSDAPSPSTPPDGFNSVLTRQQWVGVIDFSRNVDANLVMSVAISDGSRDELGNWTSVQARLLFDCTASAGGRVAAAEFMNEPTMAAMGGAPRGYDAAAFGRDVAAFRKFLERAAPESLLLGPGSVGEGGPAPFTLASGGMLRSEDLLTAAGPVFDVFSYHYYGAVSKRAASMGLEMQTTASAALSDDWLSRTARVQEFYAALRDQYEPGKPLWVTETAESAAGGNPWAATFIDCFRYLNQLGCLAQRGVQVIIHNTLASSDYGLLDPDTKLPRPNYWAALLWRELMGTTVLDPGVQATPNLRVYAHSLRNRPGGVALLVINADQEASQDLEITSPAERYTMTAKELMDESVELNGVKLELDPNDELPALASASEAPGVLRFAPCTITFLALADAGNDDC